MSDTKVRIKEQHLEKVMATYLSISDDKYETPHNVTPGTLRKIPSEIHNPIAVFKSSTRENSYLVLTVQYEQKADIGNNAPIAVIFNINTGKNDIGIINIGSIYGRSQNQLIKDFTENLLYANKEKSQKFLNTERLQLPWDFTSDTSNLSHNYKTEQDQDLSQYLFSKKVDELTQVLHRNFGKSAIDTLIDSGQLQITSLDVARQQTGIDMPNNADGFYLNGKAILIADNLNSHSVSATFLHELGGHGGIATLLGDEYYQRAQRDFLQLVDDGEPLAVEAYALAHKNNPNHPKDEYIPYLLTLSEQKQQTTPKAEQFVANLLSRAKWFLRDKLGIDIRLTPNDFVMLAKKQINDLVQTQKVAHANDFEARFSHNTPKDELQAIRQQYEKTDEWLKAPNGAPSQLTEQQWLQVRTSSLKRGLVIGKMTPKMPAKC